MNFYDYKSLTLADGILTPPCSSYQLPELPNPPLGPVNETVIGPVNGVLADLFPASPFFPFTVADGLDRTVPHTIRVTMLFLPGSHDDVVIVWVDGLPRYVGTSWEDYFRECQPPGSRTVDSILFRTGGTAAPKTLGKGFLIDNLSIRSAVPDPLL